MHIERNVCHTLLLYLFEDRDTIGIQRDMSEAEAMLGLQLVQQGNNTMYFKSHAPYVFSSAKKVLFLNTMSSI